MKLGDDKAIGNVSILPDAPTHTQTDNAKTQCCRPISMIDGFIMKTITSLKKATSEHRTLYRTWHRTTLEIFLADCYATALACTVWQFYRSSFHNLQKSQPSGTLDNLQCNLCDDCHPSIPFICRNETMVINLKHWQQLKASKAKKQYFEQRTSSWCARGYWWLADSKPITKSIIVKKNYTFSETSVST